MGNEEVTRTPTSLGDLARAIPHEHRRIVPARAWWTLARTFTLVIVSQLALYLTPLRGLWWLLLVPLMLFAGLSFVGIFVLGHDCGHYAFSRRRWVNDLVGTLCHLPILNGFFGWRAAHDFHHRRTQIRGVDPDWPELLYTQAEAKTVPWHQRLAVRLGPGSPVGIAIGFWVGMLKRALPDFLIPQMRLRLGEKLKLYGHSLLSAAVAFLLLRTYLQLVGAEKFIIMYVIPALVGTATGALLTFLHHSHPGAPVFDASAYDPFVAQVRGTFNVRFPRLFEWLWLDINLHLVHHVLPSVPWYQLRRATADLQRLDPALVQERKFSWGLLRECWRATRLEGTGQGAYFLAQRS